MSSFIRESDLNTPQEEVKTENIIQNIPQIENITAQNVEKKSEKIKNLKVIFWIGILLFLLLSGAIYLIYVNTSQSISEKQELQENSNWSITSEGVANLWEKTTSQTQEKSKNDVQDNTENNTAMNRYLMRTRDSNRLISLKGISLSLWMFFIDKVKLPQELSSGCVPVAELGGHLKVKVNDPLHARLNDGCTDANAESTFGYRVLENTEKSQKYILSATMEDEKSGNSPYSIDELVKNPELLKEVESGKYSKNGKYYIIIENIL